MAYWPYILGFTALVITAVALYLRNQWPRPWIAAKDGDFQQAFLTLVAKDPFWASNPALRETLCKILTSWSERDCDGVILECQDSPKFQMIDFYGPSKVMGKPMVKIQWSYAQSERQAMAFINEDDVETIVCAPDYFRILFEHLARCCVDTGNVDAMSGCKVYEGFLSPSYKSKING